jgi:N-acetylglucosamine kinase
MRQESSPSLLLETGDAFGTTRVFASVKRTHLAYAFCMRYVLGFDGGASKTECVLMDETSHVVSQSRGGPSNPNRVGFGGAMASVSEAGHLAVSNAGVSADDIKALCAGLAGTAHPESALKMKRLLEEKFPCRAVRVCTDLDLTLEGAGTKAAIVLIAGTGSAAIGRDAKGKTERVGGHGYLLGDEGSAYHVGQRSVREALRHFERTGQGYRIGKAHPGGNRRTFVAGVAIADQ